MLLYLTYNDQPSGVYWSQVTDVVDHLNTLGREEVRLVALVSVRDLRNTRRRIKARSPKAWVLPMVPQMKRWRMNTALLASVCRLLKPSGIIARGPFATWMALRMRDRKLTADRVLRWSRGLRRGMGGIPHHRRRFPDRSVPSAGKGAVNASDLTHRGEPRTGGRTGASATDTPPITTW